MEKGKRVETMNGEFDIPEPMIQHVQSFLSGREAARTTILSKSWYNAWLTRPRIDFDYHRIGQRSLQLFEKCVKKTVQRYLDSSLKIESFRLCRNIGDYDDDDDWDDERDGESDHDITRMLIINAMKLGASDVELNLDSFTLPQEVFGSETLLRLSLNGCCVGLNYRVSCLRLKSLRLVNADISSSDVFEDIISCLILIEELSLCFCRRLKLRGMNLYELPKLRRLFLTYVHVDSTFFVGFASRFPCLKDLTILRCGGCTRTEIASTSLETIMFQPYKISYMAKFDTPNIRKFTYLASGSGLPNISIKANSREWELDITVTSGHCDKFSWFRNLKKLLKRFRLSRISLSLAIWCRPCVKKSAHEVDTEVVAVPLILENLMIDHSYSFCYAILLRLLRIFRPKFITIMFDPRSYNNSSLDMLYNNLMDQVITPNSGIPDKYIVEQFRLKKVNLEVYEMLDADWRPLLLKEPYDLSKALVSKQKVRFELIWD